MQSKTCEDEIIFYYKFRVNLVSILYLEPTCCEEKKYKYQGGTSVNVVTILLLLFTTLSASYINKDNFIQWQASLYEKISIRTNQNVSTKAGTNQNVSTKIGTNQKLTTEPNKTKVDMNSVNRKNRKDSKINSYDKKIINQINEGEQYFNQGQYPECISFFEKLLKAYVLSPRAVYGQAKCLDKLSETMRSNSLLSKAIIAYEEVANQPEVTSELLILALTTAAKRYIFLGKTRQAVVTLNKLAKRLPKNTAVLNELGISYMTMGAYKQATPIFREVSDTFYRWALFFK